MVSSPTTGKPAYIHDGPFNFFLLLWNHAYRLLINPPDCFIAARYYLFIYRPLSWASAPIKMLLKNMKSHIELCAVIFFLTHWKFIVIILLKDLKKGGTVCSRMLVAATALRLRRLRRVFARYDRQLHLSRSFKHSEVNISTCCNVIIYKLNTKRVYFSSSSSGSKVLMIRAYLPTLFFHVTLFTMPDMLLSV